MDALRTRPERRPYPRFEIEATTLAEVVASITLTGLSDDLKARLQELAERMDEGRRRSYLLEYLHEVMRPSMPILSYDATAAQWHGEAHAELERDGLSTLADGQIAAIAGVNDLTVVTDNTSDFAPFAELEEGIHVENWVSA